MGTKLAKHRVINISNSLISIIMDANSLTYLESFQDPCDATLRHTQHSKFSWIKIGWQRFEGTVGPINYPQVVGQIIKNSRNASRTVYKKSKILHLGESGAT